jgi:hypothetical protein
MVADDLSRFIVAIRDARLLTDSGFQSFKVKFGQSIDQNADDITRYECTLAEMVILHDIEWDIDVSNPRGIQEIIDLAMRDERRIYRAAIELGYPIDDVVEPITRKNSPENKTDFYPDTLSIQVGPIYSYNLESNHAQQAGWIAVGISGAGYLYPWTLNDVIERLEKSPHIRRIMEACRAFWPVADPKPELSIAKVQRHSADFGPYEEVGKPCDWHWCVAESG